MTDFFSLEKTRFNRFPLNPDLTVSDHSRQAIPINVIRHLRQTPILLIFLALHNKKYKIGWDEVAR